jgi:hypothetical protein
MGLHGLLQGYLYLIPDQGRCKQAGSVTSIRGQRNGFNIVVRKCHEKRVHSAKKCENSSERTLTKCVRRI